MQEKKLKVYKIILLIAGGVCLVSAVWLVVLWALADWKFFSIKPIWLAFLLMLILGIGLMLLCGIGYLQISLKEKIADTVLCKNCGAECHISSAFCQSCGAKLSEDE